MHDRRREIMTRPSILPQRQVAATIERTPDYFPIYTVGGRWHHDGRTVDRLDRRLLRRHDVAILPPQRRPAWRERAEHYSRLLEHRQHDRNVHDLGFIFLNTYRPWYELTGDERLHDVLIQAGRTLALRFQEKGQYLARSSAPESLFIDIMMNVPLIFYAASETSDAELRRIADGPLPHHARHAGAARRLDGPRRHLRHRNGQLPAAIDAPGAAGRQPLGPRTGLVAVWLQPGRMR